MGATVTTSIAITKSLLNRVDILVQHLNISRSQLFEMALEDFIQNYQVLSDLNDQSSSSYQDAKPAVQSGGKRLSINQGDVYWVQLAAPSGSELDIPHPHVVIQDNVFNHSRIDTVVICALTSNTNRATIPGNVLLEVDEANLPRQSVVEVSKVAAVDKTWLGEYIGSLSEQRINQILAGMRFLQRSFFYE